MCFSTHFYHLCVEASISYLYIGISVPVGSYGYLIGPSVVERIREEYITEPMAMANDKLRPTLQLSSAKNKETQKVSLLKLFRKQC